MIQASSPLSAGSSSTLTSLPSPVLGRLSDSPLNLASPEGPAPEFDFDSGTLALSPLTPSAPPPYTFPFAHIGDEPTGYYSDKSAPPPYASADPEPVATALLHREVAAEAAAIRGREQAARTSTPLRLAVRAPTAPAAAIGQLRMSLTPHVGLRTAARTAAPFCAATPSFVLVSAGGRIGNVPELRSPRADGFVPRRRGGSDGSGSSDSSDSDSDYSSYSDDDGDSEDAGADGADPAWCGRVAIWSAASHTRRIRRRGSMGSIPLAGPAPSDRSRTV